MKPFSILFWIAMAPVSWAVGDLLWPLVTGNPSIILTHLGWSLRFGC